VSISQKGKSIAASIKETQLYPPVKAYFTARGYEVKGEVGAADLVAVPAGAPEGSEPIIVELKTSFSLTLFHQAINRQSMSDQADTVKLPENKVVVHCEPAPFVPRKIKKKKLKLLSEFERRHGDPNEGGMTSSGMMTSYRQGALRCAKVLHDEGACKGSYVAKMAGFEKATTLMRSNYYGWFEKIESGIYGLTPAGAKALDEHADRQSLTPFWKSRLGG